MDGDPQYDIEGSGNIIGDHSQSITQSVTLDTEPIRQLTNRLEETTNVIAVLSNKLGGQVVLPRRDWAAYVILFVFVVFCLAIIFSPLWLSPQLPNSSDAQNLILTISSAMSGVTGLLGVLVGGRTRLYRL